MTETIVVTLREIADAAGIGIEGARARAKRRDRAGTWRVLPSNHPADPLRVEMPREDLGIGSARPPSNLIVSPPTDGTTNTQHEPPNNSVLDALRSRVRELQSDLVRERTERQQERERADTARERVDGLTDEITKLAGQLAAVASDMKDAATAKARAEAIVEAERLTHAAERDRLANEMEAARHELISWRSASWWKRLAG